MEKHISLVATLHIGLSILGLLLAAVVFAVLIGSGVVSQDEEAMFVLTIVAVSMLTISLVTSVPAIIGGIGLLKYKSWARIVILIISAIDLLNIPFGTALGVYSLWTLLNDETVKLFEGKAAAKSK